MKIAWLVNIVMPELAEDLGLWKTSLGGWLIGQMNGLKKAGYPLTILSISKDIHELTWRTLHNVDFCVIPDQPEESIRETFRAVLGKIKPDVFHIFGTETSAAAIAFSISDTNHTVVSIQGFVGVYANHVRDGIPEKYYKATWLKRLGKRWLHGSVIADDAHRLAKSGLRESGVLENARHVIGRTTWDRAYMYHRNPKAKYYVCREILRESFYGDRWDAARCQRHTIFLSQSASPIKGLHQVLKALPMILRKYPDTVVFIAGAPLSNFPKRNPIKQKAVEYFSGYQGYIESLVRENNLYGKIHFLNYLDESSMMAQYLKANVFVLPSAIENSPNSLGEAMLLGVPCVASCVGGVQDMLTAPEEGFIYPFDEPYMLAYYVCRIFESDELAMSISQKARAHAAKTHNQEENTKDLLEIYRKVGGFNG